jgi:hypothetical protein
MKTRGQRGMKEDFCVKIFIILQSGEYEDFATSTLCATDNQRSLVATHIVIIQRIWKLNELGKIVGVDCMMH